MKPSFRSFARESQQGSVAIEAAVCIGLILVPLIFFMFSFGKFFWHYTVVQKALHDATLYMAKAPLSEVRSGAAGDLANFIIEAEIADLDSGTKLMPLTQCGFRTNTNNAYMGFRDCNTPNLVPFAVQTNAVMTMPDPFYFWDDQGSEITFFHISTMRHAGK